MIVKKPKQGKKAAAKRTKPTDWKEALRLHLSKVPTVDAVFVNTEKGVVHVYSIVKELRERYYEGLLETESEVEAAFPKTPFEFHTWAHQGRPPAESGPLFSNLVYLR